MRIVFDARFIEQRNTGVGFCTLALMNHLKEEGPGHEWTFLRDGVHFTAHPWSDLWLHGYLPWFLARQRADIFFSPAFYLPRFTLGARRVTMVHDLAVYRHPESFPLKFTLYFKGVIRQAIRNADHIIVNSAFTKSEVMEVFPRRSEQDITVIPLGPAPRAVSAQTEDSRLVDQLGGHPYFLHVGSLEPRKNLLRLIHAFLRWSEGRPEWRLVLAGNPGWYGRELTELFMDHTKRVLFVGYVADHELPPLYRAAKGLLFPSLYEGFGLPILEAITYDVPLAISNIPSFQEIDQGMSVAFDPVREDDMEAALEALALQSALGYTGHPRKAAILDHYSWSRAARILLSSFQALS